MVEYIHYIKIIEFRENEHLYHIKFSNAYIFIKLFYAFDNVLWLSGYEKLFIKLILRHLVLSKIILYSVFNFFFLFLSPTYCWYGEIQLIFVLSLLANTLILKIYLKILLNFLWPNHIICEQRTLCFTFRSCMFHFFFLTIALGRTIIIILIRRADIGHHYPTQILLRRFSPVH